MGEPAFAVQYYKPYWLMVAANNESSFYYLTVYSPPLTELEALSTTAYENPNAPSAVFYPIPRNDQSGGAVAPTDEFYLQTSWANDNSYYATWSTMFHAAAPKDVFEIYHWDNPNNPLDNADYSYVFQVTDLYTDNGAIDWTGNPDYICCGKRFNLAAPLAQTLNNSFLTITADTPPLVVNDSYLSNNDSIERAVCVFVPAIGLDGQGHTWTVLNCNEGNCSPIPTQYISQVSLLTLNVYDETNCVPSLGGYPVFLDLDPNTCSAAVANECAAGPAPPSSDYACDGMGQGCVEVPSGTPGAYTDFGTCLVNCTVSNNNPFDEINWKRFGIIVGVGAAVIFVLLLVFSLLSRRKKKS